MGTYNLSAGEIADKLDDIEFESELDGDFCFEDFILGAIKYIEFLKVKGMSCPSKNLKLIKKFKKDLEQ